MGDGAFTSMFRPGSLIFTMECQPYSIIIMATITIAIIILIAYRVIPRPSHYFKHFMDIT